MRRRTTSHAIFRLSACDRTSADSGSRFVLHGRQQTQSPWQRVAAVALVAIVRRGFYINALGVSATNHPPPTRRPGPALALPPDCRPSVPQCHQGIPLDQIFCDGLVEMLTSSLTQLERFSA